MSLTGVSTCWTKHLLFIATGWMGAQRIVGVLVNRHELLLRMSLDLLLKLSR